MLALPSIGFSRSVNKHNVDLNICADWVEGSVLFGGDEVTKSDVVDVLRGNEFYDDQSFAGELLDDVFASIRERSRVSGANYPIKIGQSRLTCRSVWDEYSPYAFCLTASLARLYPAWALSFGPDHRIQGELFELLTADAMRAQYIGWEVIATGWTRASQNRIGSVATSVANALGETTGDLAAWTTEDAKEAGLDLLCFRPYSDARPGLPAFLVQCASGNDWKSKLKTPDLRIWTKIVSFPNDPKKALSMPFALSHEDFRRHCNVLDGLLLDRLRLLSHQSARSRWLTPATETSLISWVANRVTSLPQLEAA